MQHELMIERLKALKLHGMAQALTDLVQQDSPAYQSCSPVSYTHLTLPTILLV